MSTTDGRPSTGVPGARYSAADLAALLGQAYAPTAEQAAVIEAPLESTLVVAGAGSGKTETMAARVVWLVANGYVDPAEVLGLTFTRKAAGELAERISARLRTLRASGAWRPEAVDGEDPDAGAAVVSTYHAYAGQLVSEHGLRLGLEPDARLLTEAAAWQHVTRLVDQWPDELEGVDKSRSTIVSSVLGLAGEMAEHLVTSADLEAELTRWLAVLDTVELGPRRSQLPPRARQAQTTWSQMRALVPLIDAYAARKRDLDLLDFADQMAFAARLAQQIPRVGAVERARYRVVLLDEFQDTSEAQMVLLSSLFGGGTSPVMAVGDPHQSIYGWRGASATTLQRFPREFLTPRGAEAPVLTLSTSWRNDAAVLEVANVVAEPLRRSSRVPVRALGARPGAGPGAVTVERHETIEREAAAVAAWLAARWQDAGGEPLGRTAAVLCRARTQFEPVVTALRAAGLPVEVVGVGGLLAMPEVSDLLAALHVVHDPSRGDHLMRLLTGPVARLSAADVDGLAAWARELDRRWASPSASSAAPTGPSTRDDRLDPVTIVEALDALAQGAGIPVDWRGPEGQTLSGTARDRLSRLALTLQGLRERASLPLVDLVVETERALGLDVELLARSDVPAGSARAQVEALVDVVAAFTASVEQPTLDGLLAYLTAAEERERGLSPGEVEVTSAAVQVLTVHASKGLEWDVVAVPGLSEGTFPSHSARTSHVDGEWVNATPTDSAWTSGLDGGLPWPLRGDRAGLPELGLRGGPVRGEPMTAPEAEEAFEQFGADAGGHQLLEERRLAYVAFTRARQELLLTSPVWSTQVSPRIPSRFVTEILDEPVPGVHRGHWAATPEDADAVNPRLGDPASAVWPVPVDDSSRARRAVLDSAALVERALAGDAGRGSPRQQEVAGPEHALHDQVTLLLAERDALLADPGTAEVELPAHLSTTQVVALARDPQRFALDLRRPVPVPPSRAARRGTAFHAWVEQHYGQAALLDVLEMPGSADGESDEGSLAAVTATFLASEWAQRTPVAIETPIETQIAGHVIRGRIDAVFPRDDGGWTVVDWKTGERPRGEDADRVALQLACYRTAWSRLQGVPVELVDGAFYYTASGETVRPDLPAGPELDARLAALTGDAEPGR